MFEVWAHSILSVAVVSSLSLVGIIILFLGEKVYRSVILYLVSFSVGSLFGGAFLHLIPEAAGTGFSIQVSFNILIGILASFVLEEVFKWRHCHVPTSSDHPHSFGYMNLLGDAIHNLIDGVAIGGAYLVSTAMGLTTTLAVCLHELPQEMGDFGVLIYAGFGKRKALVYNFVTALTAFVGVSVALSLSFYIEGLTSFLIPFAAGNFIYIAGSDLIPELHTEEKLGRTIFKIAIMTLGILLLYSIRIIFENSA